MYHDLPSFMYINSNSLEKLQSTTGSGILYRKVYRKCTIAFLRAAGLPKSTAASKGSQRLSLVCIVPFFPATRQTGNSVRAFSLPMT